MALTQCEECEKEISDKAEACPHCGAPKKTKPRKNGCGCGTLIVLGFLLVFFGAIISQNNNGVNPKVSAVKESTQKRVNITKEKKQIPY